MSKSPVALITGGASGIGLALAKRLLKLQWNVAILDRQPVPDSDAGDFVSRTSLFVKTNVASYQEQAKAFSQTYNKWNRLDLVFANAGILDPVDFCAPQQETEHDAPPQPDLTVLDVDLNGVIWSSYLALHYFRKDKSITGKLVMTSSTAGIYATPEVPLYSAAKHGVVGLARSLGNRMKEQGESITVNAIVPGTVATGILPSSLINAVPSQYLTSASLIVQGIETILNDSYITGQVLECNGNDIANRPPPAYLNEACEYMVGGKYREQAGKDAVLNFGIQQKSQSQTGEIQNSLLAENHHVGRFSS